MNNKALGGTLATFAAVGLATFAGGLAVGRLVLAEGDRTPAYTAPVAPPPDTAMPKDELGKQIARGREIFVNTGHAVPGLVGNDMACSNCHLDAGRRAYSAPLWGAYGLFPQYRKKNGHVNTFAERVRECFLYSMNGKAPAYDDPDLRAVESYAAFLARGQTLGVKTPGQGYLKLAPPLGKPDPGRGQAVYAENCAACHGADGAGRKTGEVVAIPPLWGPRSYNWGAGMAELRNAAGFIKANMPQNRPGVLTDQQAWDVAAYVDGKPRPQDPRYAGSVAETRRRFHDDPQSLYGQTVGGVLLGGDGPPRRSGR